MSEIVPTSVRSDRWKKKKKRGHPKALCPWRKFQPNPASPTHTLKLVNVSHSRISQRLFQLLPLHWDLEKAQLWFSTAFGSLRCKPQARCYGAPILAASPPGWGLGPSLFGGGTSKVVKSLSLVGHHMGSGKYGAS